MGMHVLLSSPPSGSIRNLLVHTVYFAQLISLFSIGWSAVTCLASPRMRRDDEWFGIYRIIVQFGADMCCFSLSVSWDTSLQSNASMLWPAAEWTTLPHINHCSRGIIVPNSWQRIYQVISNSLATPRSILTFFPFIDLHRVARSMTWESLDLKEVSTH